MLEHTYRPSHIANFFLNKARQEEDTLTQLKLLKLVYLGYGWTAALLEKKLFDEPIEAWKHGPVVPSLYHEFKHFGSDPIEGASISFDLDSGEITKPEISKEDSDLELVLSFVWDIYKRFSAWDLRGKTHEPGTPWSDTYESGYTNKEIAFDLIRQHFTRKIEEYLSDKETQ